MNWNFAPLEVVAYDPGPERPAITFLRTSSSRLAHSSPNVVIDAGVSTQLK